MATSQSVRGLRARKPKKPATGFIARQAARLMEIPGDDVLAVRDKAIFELFIRRACGSLN
jgi:site-specific recombinase XerC